MEEPRLRLNHSRVLAEGTPISCFLHNVNDLAVSQDCVDRRALRECLLESVKD